MLVESANVLKSASTPLNLRPQLILDSLKQQLLPLYCYTVAITAAIGGAILPNSCLYRADDSERLDFKLCLFKFYFVYSSHVNIKHFLRFHCVTYHIVYDGGFYLKNQMFAGTNSP